MSPTTRTCRAAASSFVSRRPTRRAKWGERDGALFPEGRARVGDVVVLGRAGRPRDGRGVGVVRWRVARHRAQESRLLVLVEQRTRSLSEEKVRAEEALAKAEEARADAERHREVAERATAEAEEASRTKSRFLANVSHELRTPLNAIIGYSEMLSEEASEEGSAGPREGPRARPHRGLHQLELVSSVLDLPKVEAGRLDLELATFPLALLVEETTAIVRPLLAKNRNALVVRCPAERTR
ncbi:MAG: hypothetical protein IPN03_17320 [Holophagales bacterium]|nr:hypothetical protein [Holophagales bacterium]